jgi:hypothetical protein
MLVFFDCERGSGRFEVATLESDDRGSGRVKSVMFESDDRGSGRINGN